MFQFRPDQYLVDQSNITQGVCPTASLEVLAALRLGAVGLLLLSFRASTLAASHGTVWQSVLSMLFMAVELRVRAMRRTIVVCNSRLDCIAV
jgi:hypothetical protein